MTLSRRTFTFASLVAALTPKVGRAEIPEVADALPEVPAGKASMRTKVDVVQKGALLEVTLRVTNDGPDTSVLTAQGSRPGPALSLFVNVAGAEVELERVVEPVDRREMMSRIGPLPRFEEIKHLASIDAGPYRFLLRAGQRPPASVRGTISTMEGEVPFTITGVTWGAAPAGA